MKRSWKKCQQLERAGWNIIHAASFGRKYVAYFRHKSWKGKWIKYVNYSHGMESIFAENIPWPHTT